MPDLLEKIVDSYATREDEHLRARACVAYAVLGTDNGLEKMLTRAVVDDSKLVRTTTVEEIQRLPPERQKQAIHRIREEIASSDKRLRANAYRLLGGLTRAGVDAADRSAPFMRRLGHYFGAIRLGITYGASLPRGIGPIARSTGVTLALLVTLCGATLPGLKLFNADGLGVLLISALFAGIFGFFIQTKNLPLGLHYDTTAECVGALLRTGWLTVFFTLLLPLLVFIFVAAEAKSLTDIPEQSTNLVTYSFVWPLLTAATAVGVRAATLAPSRGGSEAIPFLRFLNGLMTGTGISLVLVHTIGANITFDFPIVLEWLALVLASGILAHLYAWSDRPLPKQAQAMHGAHHRLQIIFGIAYGLAFLFVLTLPITFSAIEAPKSTGTAIALRAGERVTLSKVSFFEPVEFELLSGDHLSILATSARYSENEYHAVVCRYSDSGPEAEFLVRGNSERGGSIPPGRYYIFMSHGSSFFLQRRCLPTGETPRVRISSLSKAYAGAVADAIAATPALVKALWQGKAWKPRNWRRDITIHLSVSPESGSNLARQPPKPTKE
ncbi:hypothetical protein [Azospirillum sp. TSO22-1]|uniref:hypothetical protein n=1 Tax=Azospirillum sp. TSO22-1 TaxID=716789 RepID=UPI000D612AFB|nr:hypothetical protein [Azospirillum sp. TSO22-1]PWC40160.1 hypothetical protein TSO221_25630 [Azospirillum sp. TSO22-1]